MGSGAPKPNLRRHPALPVIGGVAAVAAWYLAVRYWMRPCPAWLSWLFESPMFEGITSEATVEHLALRPGMAVLDAGCGPARLTVPMARQVGPRGQVVGLDVQPEMLRRAQAKVDAAGLRNVELRQAGVGQAGLERDHFDRAVLATVIGEIDDPQAALREIAAALKPGGFLSVTELALDPHFRSQGTVRRLAQAAGLRERERFGNALAYTLNLEKPEK